ncbi:hypothetical protein CDO28_01475 [Sinorhizobium meliloti]|uniref:hypothetical protein n=1 Tax=Rhizobium meliloti TaxID=382 RepID=UPI000B4A2AE2|nr:hypothetical protein [Sinorhizobium meliloti]ASP70357.1 hypothetical protein CDO28_01475 [Sinorhizobium meliloti]MDE3854792.1 hypothetical protein [Sinorhizobium meliloti]MQW52470.1 hypothetical protein [Sinorhizobium meliloti]
MKVTNSSPALQGVRSKGRAVYINPGETRDVNLEGVDLDKAKRLPFLKIEGVSKPASNQDGDGPKTALEVLEMAKDPNVQFMSFKAAAAKLLGDKTPAKKDDIIAALEELATQP